MKESKVRVGSKIKYYNMKTKRNRTATVTSINDDMGAGRRYEMDNSQFVYSDDVVEVLKY